MVSRCPPFKSFLLSGVILFVGKFFYWSFMDLDFFIFVSKNFRESRYPSILYNRFLIVVKIDQIAGRNDVSEPYQHKYVHDMGVLKEHKNWTKNSSKHFCKISQSIDFHVNCYPFRSILPWRNGQRFPKFGEPFVVFSIIRNSMTLNSFDNDENIQLDIAWR